MKALFLKWKLMVSVEDNLKSAVYRVQAERIHGRKLVCVHISGIRKLVCVHV